MYVMAVSYTHLDVYKRQRIMSIQSDIEMLSIEALEHLVFESRKDM